MLGFMIITVYAKRELFCNEIRWRGSKCRAQICNHEYAMSLFTSLDARLRRRQRREIRAFIRERFVTDEDFPGHIIFVTESETSLSLKKCRVRRMRRDNRYFLPNVRNYRTPLTFLTWGIMKCEMHKKNRESVRCRV